MRLVVAGTSTIVSLMLTAAATIAAPAPTGSLNMVIAELRTRGPNGATDEFIELFNRSGTPVVLDGWQVWRSSATGVTTLIKQIPANTTVPAGGFYLLANSAGYSQSVVSPADLLYTGGIDDGGGVALFDNQSGIVDQVGMGAGSAYLEGSPLTAMISNINQSFERNNGGCYPNQDTDNNAVDFHYNKLISYPKDAASTCSTSGCAGVVCQSAPDPQCADSLSGSCSNGTCSYTPFNQGISCSDDDACTANDSCDGSGSCQSGTAVTCNHPPDNFCQDSLTLATYPASVTCDHVNGCVYTFTTSSCQWGCNGSTGACNPNPCTGVSCEQPVNDCYEPVGQCSLGVCDYTPKAQGIACQGSNLCFTGDTCNGTGVCQNGTAVPVDDSNPCTVDACDPGTGTVSHTPVTNGINCDDGNACNGVSTCQNGACTQTVPVVVCNQPPPGDCINSVGTCAQSTGICSYAPLAQGTSCNDGNLCTSSDVCDGAGSCAGAAVNCPNTYACSDNHTSELNWSGSCDGSTGQCVYSHQFTSCAVACDPNYGRCTLDPCLNITCNTPPDNCHQAQGTCNSNDGSCLYPLKTAGSSCNDNNICTTTDQCSSAGACVGSPIDCNTPPATSVCLDSGTSRTYNPAGICLAGTNTYTCDYTFSDTTCTFGCTQGTGLCKGDPCLSVNCDQPPDQCHQTQGTCALGLCSYGLKLANSTCDDGNTCTDNDV